MSDTRDPAYALTAQRHLACLRGLLRRDYLTRADWLGSLKETAEIARAALAADEALVALYDGATAAWTAWTSGGDRVAGDAIRIVASRSILDAVRISGKPLLTTAESPLLVRSESTREHDVRSVLAVPLRWWQGQGDSAGSTLGGCLYADRRGASQPFADSDVDLVLDLAGLAERTLSLVRQLTSAEETLDTYRSEVQLGRTAAAQAHRGGHYESRDQSFVDHVLTPLRRAARAGKVGLLLLGPTGSGKSHMARAFHYESSRRSGPFVVLDCGQVTSAEALAAELFGYAKRSGFNAPAEGRVGKAQMAHGGTLFIDEIGALHPDLQQRLLRLIHTGRFSPLGSAEEVGVDLQVVAASNQDLAAMVQSGAFREDLFWRIGEITLRLPPLDEHPADVAGFAEGFLAAASARFDRPEIRGFTPAALAALGRHRWSSAGNLRGLEHTVNRSVLLAPEATALLDVADIAFHVGPRVVERRSDLAAPTAGFERAASAGEPGRPDPIAELLGEKIRLHRGNLRRLAEDPEVVAALAGGARSVPPSTLRLRIRRLGLEPLLAEARSSAGVGLERIREALLAHRDAGRAAAALGLTRDALVWRLRRAGLTVRGVLAGRQP